MATLKRLIIFIALFSVINTMAQNDDCELTLSRSEDEFNAGHFYVIPSLLNPCLSQFTKEQRQRAYVLLAQTYLLLDDPIGARQSYLEVLKANPEFQTDTTLHPIDLIYLSKKFTATPIFSWLVKAGPNVSPIRIIYDLNAYGQNGVHEYYKLRVGYNASVGGDINFTDKISLRGELNYSYTSYRHQSVNSFRSPKYLTSDKKVFTDRQSWLSIPVMASYGDPIGKYRPYGYLGYSVQYLLSDKADIVTTDRKPGISENIDNNQESPPFDYRYKRNPFNQSVLVGGGLKLKLGTDFLFVDLRYGIGLKNVVKEQNAYGNYSKYNNSEGLTSEDFIQSLESATVYSHVEDYFRLDNLSISFGFLRPLYKPRELKKARTRSVMRDIKNN